MRRAKSFLNKSYTAKLIKDARKKSGMTQAELAKKLGYETPQMISLIERAESKLPFSKLGKICRALDIPMENIAIEQGKAYYEFVKRELAR